MTTCKPCEVAGFLEEEAEMDWYGEDEAENIRIGARDWHDKCRGCDCEVTPRDKTLLRHLRKLHQSLFRDLHVR